MAKINLEDVICWADEQGNILCPACLRKEFLGHYPSAWTPIFSDENSEEEYIYECDTCKERMVN